MDDGIYTNIGWADYKALDRMNCSTLKAGRRSMRHLQHAINNPRGDSDAMRLGRATHMAVLEPDKYASSVAVAPSVDRRTKAGKQAHAEFVAGAEGKEVITAAEDAQAVAIAESVANTPAAMVLLDDTTPETTIINTDESVLVKGRMDAYGPGLIVDLKTTNRLDGRQFGRISEQFGYHVSLGLYARWVRQLTGDRPAVWLVVVETAAPFDCVVMKMGDDVLDEGERIGVGLLQSYRHALKTGNWPGIGGSTGCMDLDWPAWALNSEDVELNIGGQEVRL